MLTRAFVLRMLNMKNSTGILYSIISEDFGIFELKGYSARQSSTRYMGLDYFREFELDIELRKNKVKLENINRLNNDFSKNFITNRKAYSYMSYIHLVLVKVLLPINSTFSKNEYAKIFSNLIYMYKNLPVVNNDRAILLVYRFLSRIYIDSGFLDAYIDVEQDSILEQIRSFHKQFLDNSIDCI